MSRGPHGPRHGVPRAGATWAWSWRTLLFLLSQICPASSTSLHHHRLGLVSKKALAPWGNWSKVSWYVSYLIIITFLCTHYRLWGVDLTRLHSHCPMSVCASLDLDLEAISFLWASVYFLFVEYSSIDFLAFATSSSLDSVQISTSFPRIFARWYFG